MADEVFRLEAAAAQPAAATEPSGTQRVELVPDQKNGVLRVVIDGKEVARFDASGLQVRESIEYGGVQTDTGPEYYDQHPQGGSGQ